MESVVEDSGAAKRAYQRKWREKNKDRLTDLRRRREKEQRRKRLFERTGYYDIPEGMKWCYMCKSIKPVDCFYRRKPTKRHPSTHRSWCKQCDQESARRERKHNYSYRKDWKLKRDFGITLSEYQRLVEIQGNRCAICTRHPSETGTKYELSVDHDHETGVIRGLLCSGCNIGLGKLGDNVHGLRRALDYLLGVRSNDTKKT